MITTLEKYWPYISILLLLLLLAAPFAWPGATVLLGVVAVILGVGAVILFSVHGHVKAHRDGRLDRAGLFRNIAIDVPGLLLTIPAAAFAGRAVGQLAGDAARRFAEQAWPSWSGAAGILCSLLAGLLVGLIVGFAVKTVWRKLFKTKELVPVETRA
jgi:hypothetical protein